MRLTRSLVAVCSCFALASCENTTSPEPTPAPDLHFRHFGPTSFGVGAGRFAIGELSVRYIFSGLLFGNGSAIGSFYHSVDLGEGERAEFVSKVTCLAFDPANGRAWFGGVILKNNSTAGSGFVGAITQPGKDIWFRVLDTGQSADPDRSTFVGFEGSAGFTTSAEYCQGKPWPDLNARTNPVTQGEIVLKSH